MQYATHIPPKMCGSSQRETGVPLPYTTPVRTTFSIKPIALNGCTFPTIRLPV